MPRRRVVRTGMLPLLLLAVGSSSALAITGGRQVSADTASSMFGLDSSVFWSVAGGPLHRWSAGRETQVKEPRYARHVELGRDARGRDVLVWIVCGRTEIAPCRLMDQRLGGGPVRAVSKGYLPRGTIAGDEWGTRVVIGTTAGGDIRYASRDPGTFLRRQNGSWRRLSADTATAIEVHGSVALIDAQPACFASGSCSSSMIETLDLTGRRPPRALAFRGDFGTECRDHDVCSTYESIAFDGRYAYWLELNLRPSSTPSTSEYQTVICREDVIHRGTLTRWVTPTLIGAFAVTTGSMLVANWNAYGLQPGIVRYQPTWTAVSGALPIEANGPCGTTRPSA